MKKFLFTTLLALGFTSQANAAEDCGWWGYACLKFPAESKEDALTKASDAVTMDAWRIGSSTPVFTTGGDILRRDFPDDWSDGILHHWWIISSPSLGDFVAHDSYSDFYIDPDRITRLEVTRKHFDAYTVGTGIWSVYYNSRINVVTPEPGCLGVFLFGLLGIRSRKR